MWDFNFGTAIGLMMRTLNFVLLRLLIYIGISIGYILVTGVGAGIGYGIGSIFGSNGQGAGTLIGGAMGFGIFGALMYWARAWLLYMIKAAHIAVLVQLVNEQQIPKGQTHLEYGRKVVQQRFGTSNALFGIDILIKGVVRALSGLVRGLLNMLPGGDRLGSIVQAFLRMALGFIDELILARIIYTESEEPWDSAKKSLVLYGQNYKPMLKNAAWLAAIMYLLSILVFVIMLVPAGLIAYLMPGALSGAVVIFAILLAWSIKVAVFEPLALTCMMQVYFQTIKDQQPNPEWEAKLDGMSKQFHQIKERAAEAFRKPEKPAQSPTTDVATE